MKRYDVDGVIVCGHKPPTKADFAEIAEFKRYLRGEMNTYEIRVYAGLTLRQAAKLLKFTPRELSDFENGRAKPNATRRLEMESVYGGKFVDPDATEKGGG